MVTLGSDGHQRVIGCVVAHYRDDPRVRAVAVFGSVSTGAWHHLSDVDLDIVVRDDAVIAPAAEVAALWGTRAVIVLTGADRADVVLDSLEEISLRWHALAATSPNIIATIQVVSGHLCTADIIAAGVANRCQPDMHRLLDALVRDAIYAWKAQRRGDSWNAIAAVDRVRGALTALRGRRDDLRLDPADPAAALATLLTQTAAHADLGPHRRELLAQIGIAVATPLRSPEDRLA